MNARVKPAHDRVTPAAELAARPKTWLGQPKNLACRRRNPGMNMR
jgi:hypothetical protein